MDASQVEIANAPAPKLNRRPYTGYVRALHHEIDNRERGTFSDVIMSDTDGPGGQEITINLANWHWMTVLQHALDTHRKVDVEYGGDPGPNGPNRLLKIRLDAP